MTGFGDVGEAAINRVASRLGCEPHQVTLWRRGLTWYPGGLTQHIWIDGPERQSAIAAWRVHVRTWCLKRVVASSREMVEAVEAELPHNSASALVRKPGSPSRLGLGASLRFTEDRVDWMARLMAAIARLQAHDALRLVQARPVLACGAAPDLATDRMATESAGGASAPRIADGDGGPASCEGLPFADIAESLRAHDGVRAIATHSGVTASFRWTVDGDRHDFVLLEMRVATRQTLGPGVWVSMSLPMTTPAHLLHALALNEAELSTASSTDAIGGWIVHNQTLMHESFLPWTLCDGEVIRYVADAAARRASWLRLAVPSIAPAEWPDDVRGRVLPFRRSS